MAKGLLKRLQAKVEQIHADNWGDKASPAIRLNCEVVEDPDSGRLTGRIKVYVSTEDGGEALMHERILNRIDTEEDVDDCLAETLSVVLMEHPNWPTNRP